VLSADECLSLSSQGLTSIRRSPEGAVTDWQVQLQNRCPQVGPVSVEFWMLDRNNSAIGYQRQVVPAPANAALAATGRISVPAPQSQQIASTITRYGAEPMQAAPPQSAAVAQTGATPPMHDVTSSADGALAV
jgi:hypothetical protein